MQKFESHNLTREARQDRHSHTTDEEASTPRRGQRWREVPGLLPCFTETECLPESSAVADPCPQPHVRQAWRAGSGTLLSELCVNSASCPAPTLELDCLIYVKTMHLLHLIWGSWRRWCMNPGMVGVCWVCTHIHTPRSIFIYVYLHMANATCCWRSRGRHDQARFWANNGRKYKCRKEGGLSVQNRMK